MPETVYSSIKHWPEDDRPREKLHKKGEAALSDAELLAILLRVGTRGQSALDVARNILTHFGSFRRLSQATAMDWKKFKGLGLAKTAHIRAALEIGKRFYEDAGVSEAMAIQSSCDVFNLLSPRMRDLKKEVFKVLYLDNKNRLIQTVDLASGTVDGVHPITREIFHKALELCAASFICAHNHPSGLPDPSAEDKAVTRSLYDISRSLGVHLLDHVVIGNNTFYSFADNGFFLNAADAFSKT